MKLFWASVILPAMTELSLSLIRVCAGSSAFKHVLVMVRSSSLRRSGIKYTSIVIIIPHSSPSGDSGRDRNRTYIDGWVFTIVIVDARISIF